MLGNAAKYIQMLFRNALAFWALVGLATRSLLCSPQCFARALAAVTPKKLRAGPTSLRVVLGQCQDCEMCISGNCFSVAQHTPSLQ
jgi:hypothetical protein